LSDEVQPLTTTDDIELEVKDLGPQIGWRTVFLIEYVRSLRFVLGWKLTERPREDLSSSMLSFTSFPA